MYIYQGQEMHDPERIWTSTQLPSLPTAAVDLLEASKNSSADVNEVIRIIRMDPALTARILRATNSSFFALRNEITSIERAIPLLGASFATALALGFSLIDEKMLTGQVGEHFRRYWMQSMVQASAAELLSELTRTSHKDECFQAGLLLDIGQLAILKTIGTDYIPVLERSQDEQTELVQTEDECLGFDHTVIGKKLAEGWQLAKRLQFYIANHHGSLSEILAFEYEAEFDTLRIVATASSVADYFCRSCKGSALERLRVLTQNLFQFDEERLNEFLDMARQRFDDCAEMFNFSSTSIPATSELMSEANAQLSELTLKVQMENAFVVQRQKQLEEDRKTLESENEQLQKQVFRDPLTKAYNRQFFDETLSNELRRCVRTASPFGLIFCDVDYFKQFNDTYGHLVGDQVLQHVTRVIQKTIRSCDTLARYGGEEFVILLHRPTEEGIEKISERIRHQIENEVFAFKGKQVNVTMSFGAVISIPSEYESNLAEKLVHVADEQMYLAKRTGRNRVCVQSLLDDCQRRLMQRQSAYLFSKWLIEKEVIDEAIGAKVAVHSDGISAQLGDMAVEQGFLPRDEIDEILIEQDVTGDRFGAAAIRLGKLTEDQVAYLLAKQSQEPSSVVRALVQQGVISDERACELLFEFNTQSVPQDEALERAACIG
jgi:two-component system cell cycle response regulator